MAIIKCFNLDLDTFQPVKFTSQMAFEVIRNDDNETNFNSLSYNDYTVNYYFNDDNILSISLDKFIEKMENYLWTEEEVDNYCSGGSIKNETDDSNDDNIGSNNVLIYGIVICALSVLLAVGIVINIVLMVLLKKGKKGRSDKAVSLVGVSKSDA